VLVNVVIDRLDKSRQELESNVLLELYLVIVFMQPDALYVVIISIFIQFQYQIGLVSFILMELRLC